MTEQPSKEWVIENLIRIVERCNEDEKLSPSVAVRALELLGKYLKIFGDKEKKDEVDVWSDKVISYAEENKMSEE